MSMMVESLLMAVLIQVASYVAVRQLSVTLLLKYYCQLNIRTGPSSISKLKQFLTKISK